MAKLNFTVTLDFSDKITDDETILAIAQSLVDAVANHVDKVGILPDYCDGYTQSVEVTPQFLDESIKQTF